MKFCERPWKYWWMMSAEGDVAACPWFTDQKLMIGNILNQSVEEIIQGDIVKSIQTSILDGSFRYCSSQLCTFIGNNTLPDLSKEEIDEIIQDNLPNEFNIAYDDTCNHACPSCRDCHFIADQEYYEKVDIISEKMLPYFENAKMISINGRGEVFASAHLLTMLKRLQPKLEELHLVIETNAALFDRAHWEHLEHLASCHIRVIATIPSFNDIIYRELSGYSNHVDKLITNLQYIRELREKGIINEFVISMVVQESNFRELPSFIERCLNEFLVDNVRVRGIMRFNMPEEEFWYKDMFNPAHPFYKEALAVLQHPILKDSRVWYWEGNYKEVRKPQPHPLQKKLDKFRNYYELLCAFELQNDKQELERKWHETYKNQRIAIYGSGNIGKIICRKLCEANIKVVCMIDKNPRELDKYQNIPVYRVNEIDDLSNIDIVFITIDSEYEAIEKKLVCMGYRGKMRSVDKLLM